MACNRPNGNCTSASPCGSGCGCGGGETPVVPLPRCNDVALVDGVYERATVVVQGGCITSVSTGEPEVYTPDFCCDGGGGGEGPPGPRGFPGPEGQAATIEVLPLGTAVDTNWTLQRSGTPSNVVLQFSPPLPPEGQVPVHGVTNPNIFGFSVDHGLVQGVPRTLREITFAPTPGSIAQNLFLFTNAVVGDPNNGVNAVNLNLDGLYSTLNTRMNAIETSVAGGNGAIQSDLDDIFEWITRARAFETQVSSALNTLVAAHNALLAAYQQHSAHPPAGSGGGAVPGTIIPTPTDAPGN